MTPTFFSQNDVDAFAALSGDHNPLQTNPLLARRLMFGGPVVHNINLLLWALNESIEHACRLDSLTVSFLSPVRVGESVVCQVVSVRGSVLRIELHVGNVKTTKIKATFTDAATGNDILNTRPQRGTCHEMSASGIGHAAGSMGLETDVNDLGATFPRLARCLPHDQVAVLLATTRLVGMECPGLHSVFTGLVLSFERPDATAPPRLNWRVQRFDPRFSHVTMEVAAPGAHGEITALLRPPPQDQPRYAEVKAHVAPTAFAERRALVIGGSRGLGELCGKLLAAGGADVCLTYHRGVADAESVAADINGGGGGGKATIMEMDVLNLQNGAVNALAGMEWKPTHLYYFPTPPITASSPKVFSDQLFSLFCSYYVTGFFNTVTAVKSTVFGPLSVLYPSSIYVQEIPDALGEYAAAKAAGEAVCRHLGRIDPTLTIHVERLPRLPTDQTAAVSPSAMEEPIPVLLDLLMREC